LASLHPTSQETVVNNRTSVAKFVLKRIVRRPWTKDDLRTLKSMAREKQGVKKNAKALKCSPGATSVMAVKRGISLSMRG
jgi:hypothetical protein